MDSYFASRLSGGPLDGAALTGVDYFRLRPDGVGVVDGHADSPWVTSVDRHAFGQSLDRVRRLEPTAILSSHLPPAHGQTETMLTNVAAATGAAPAPATSQAQIDALLASLAPQPA